MAKGLTASKAKKILEDGTVRGKALTEKQKKFFGAVAGGATPLKKLNGGWLDKFAMGGSLPGASGMMYARTSGTSPKEPKKAQDGTVMYGTPEYEAAYREGRFADVPNPLDEIVITAGVDYEKYPLYDKLSAQQKEYFNDPGPIGRGVRRAAQTDRGLAEDTRDMVTGMLVQQPLSALQAPQSLMVEGIEALRGRDANFLNALTFDTQRTPSQAFNVQNPYGAFALDVIADPLNVVGAGLARKSLLSPFKSALKPNPNMYYRGIGQAGLDDAIQSGLLRAKPADQVAPSMFGPFDLAKRFNNLYVTPRLGVAQRYGKGVVAEVPTDVANFSSRYKGSDWSMMTNQSIPVENVNFYKKNFFGNYRPVNVPSSTSSNFIEAAANPGIRSSLIRFGQDIMDTPSAQIRASEAFNKDWFNNPEIIRRTEEMLNQPSTLRSGMSETELLQDINLYETMLEKSPNLSAAQKANIERQMKDLYAGISKKNLETIQQKGRFTEVFDPNNKLHQDIALTYEENPNYLGFYKGRTNQGTVNVPRTTEAGKNVGSTFTHEDLHAVTAGRKGYTDNATQILEDAVGKDQDWWLNKINTEKDPKVRGKLIERLEYLSRPQEIHARVHELRKAFNLKPGQEVSAAKIDQIMMKGLKGETPVDEDFFRLLGDKEKFRKIFNKLPAYVPAAVGLGAATQMKDGGRCWPGYKTVPGKTPFSKGSCKKAEDGGWLDKFQEGGKKKGDSAIKNWWYNQEDVLDSYTMGDKVDDGWLVNWISHPETKKRIVNLNTPYISSFDTEETKNKILEKANIKAQEEIDGALNYLRETPVYTKPVGNYKDLTYNNKIQGFGLSSLDLFNLSHDGVYTGVAHFAPDYQAIYDPTGNKIVATHELSHATRDYSRDREFDMNEAIDYNYRKPDEILYRSISELNKYKDFDKTELEKFKKDYPNVFEKQKEYIDYLHEDGYYQRVMELRREMNVKPGEEITKDKIQKYKRSGAYNDLELKYTDDQILKILNTVADNSDISSKNYYAKSGKVITDNRGQWAHPGKITKINSNNITMKGVNYPVLGISDTGDTKMMQPGEDYKFKGNSVTEFPMARDGKSLVELNQLTNFTNYNTPQPGGWLDKYH